MAESPVSSTPWWRRAWRRIRPGIAAAPVVVAPTLLVPERFNRNSFTVSSLMPAEESGLWLLERMRRQIGFDTYANVRLLDFGCGVRFSQAILNTGFSIGRYVGIDCFGEMIDFLRSNVTDQRFAYYLFDVYHPLYNPDGHPLSASTPFPVVERDFDIISLFSVITHQYPPDCESLLTILRHHVAARGHLFFTCFLDESVPSFEDRSPERNGGRCVYNPTFLTELVERCGWRIVRAAGPEAPLIGHSFVCSPAARS